jgi:hypothetical protein
MQDVEPRIDREPAHDHPGGEHRDEVLTEVEADPPAGLPRLDVLDDRGDALRDERRSKAARDQQRERERARKGELLVVLATAPRDADRQHLAEQDADGQQREAQRVVDDPGHVRVGQGEHGEADAGQEDGGAVQADGGSCGHGTGEVCGRRLRACGGARDLD